MSIPPTLSSYRTISGPVHVETVEKKSRFLCALFPVTAEAEISRYLADIRREHWEANHHCSAFRLRDMTERASDDGEPSGTAGRPMLSVLQKSQVTDILAVVTRYFGGTLLGAGGLVRAYSHAVATALSKAKIVDYIPYDRFVFPVSYADYERSVRLFDRIGWELTAEFLEAVHLTLAAPSSDRTVIIGLVADLTRSQDYAEPVETVLHPRVGT